MSKPPPLNIEEEALLTNSECGSRRSSNLAYLASRRSSLSPKLQSSGGRGRRDRRQSNFLELPVLEYPKQRKKRFSLPTTHYDSDSDEELMYRLRSFNIKGDRVVNCGDSILPLEQKNSRNSSRTTSNSPSTCCNSNNSLSSISSMNFFPSEKFKVVMLGHSSVGKSALVTQFTTSEYINTYDASLDDEFGERTVSVLLDGEESELIFIDHPAAEMSVENCLATYNPHCCCVVYSVIDRHSFEVATEILSYLSHNGSKAIILVGNKCDLERAREVDFNEAKSLASTYSTKFIETSSGLQHNVDELLVGTLRQCRLRNVKKKRKRNIFNIHELARELIKKLCQEELVRSKSCQNLFF